MLKSSPKSPRHAALEVSLAFTWLGLTSFGGPVAHLGYFRRTFVDKRRWLTEAEFADIVSLCQFLPGPASSQTGFLIGLKRAGGWGALAAWVGFTLPSAALMTAFAVFRPGLSGPVSGAIIHGLKLVAVAVVAQAVWNMAQSACTDRRRVLIALLAFMIILLVPSVFAQIAAITIGSAIGLVALRDIAPATSSFSSITIPRRVGVTAAVTFVILLFGLSLAAQSYQGHTPWALASTFYQSGTLVFGGGHVVLPVLREGLVPSGWIKDDAFLAGYGAAQAMPGPLFTFAAFLGGSITPNWGLIATASLCLVSIFLPGLLLALAAYPFWTGLRANRLALAGLAGANGAVVGLLGAALYQPVATSAILSPADLAIAITGFVLLQTFKTPPLLIVGLCIASSILLGGVVHL